MNFPTKYEFLQEKISWLK